MITDDLSNRTDVAVFKTRFGNDRIRGQPASSSANANLCTRDSPLGAMIDGCFFSRTETATAACSSRRGKQT